MGHKINPTAYRLSIKLSWLSTISLIKLDFWIRKLVNGVFLAFNYFTSPCMLIHTTNYLKILVIIYDNSYNKNPRYAYIIEFLKAILEKKYNKKIIFIVRETKNKTSNAKILADWLAYNLQKQPNKLKLLEKITTNKE